MNDDILYIWLSLIHGVGPTIGSKLLNTFKNINSLYAANYDELITIDGIGEKLANTIINSKNLLIAEKIYNYCCTEKIHILKKYIKEYPIQLNKYNKAPIVLYGKGILKDSSNSVAIVGSRKCNEYGKNVTIQLATELAQNDIPIISGLAKGIDGYAHTSAIKNDSYTIAVVGTGIDICYPREHINLMNEICKHGLVLSEFQPGSKNIKQNFIKRNEVISMLSEKIVVVQASKDSGSLYTARTGIKYNKEVFAVPNSVYDIFSVGSNKLLSEGAKPYINIRSILKNKKIDNNEKLCMNSEQNRIYDIVKDYPCTIDMIKKRVKMDTEKLEEVLLEMEMKGRIKQVAGVFVKDD